jgi:hypothetical protein
MVCDLILLRLYNLQYDRVANHMVDTYKKVAQILLGQEGSINKRKRMEDIQNRNWSSRA